MFSGRTVDGSIPFYLAETVDYLRKEAERAWKEVDFISKERTEHLEWRAKLANDLDECERSRDALAVALNKAEAELAATYAKLRSINEDAATMLMEESGKVARLEAELAEARNLLQEARINLDPLPQMYGEDREDEASQELKRRLCEAIDVLLAKDPKQR